MADYTPTTGEVRAAWYEWSEYGGLSDRPESTTRAGMAAEFDRWLTDHDRRVKADAWDEGWRVGINGYPRTNPYREAT